MSDYNSTVILRSTVVVSNKCACASRKKPSSSSRLSDQGCFWSRLRAYLLYSLFFALLEEKWFIPVKEVSD